MATTRPRRLARQVSIVGAGLSQFGAYPDKSSRDLFVEAFHDMQDNIDQGISAQDIEAGYLGNYSADLFEHQGHTAPIMADWLGMTPTPITRVENACASSGSALREGVMAIASGMYDVVMVGGVEKMTSLPTEGVTDVLASAADGLYEVPAGINLPRHLRRHRQGPHGPLRNQSESPVSRLASKTTKTANSKSQGTVSGDCPRHDGPAPGAGGTTG